VIYVAAGSGIFGATLARRPNVETTGSLTTTLTLTIVPATASTGRATMRHV
jgi:hypothetical protein